MPRIKCNVEYCDNPAVLKRPKNGAPMCKECFFFCFEVEIHFTITVGRLFKRGDKIAIGASGGKDSTVLAYVLKLLNERYNYGLDLFLLSIDEGITGYRDDSLETVKQNRDDYQLPLKILSYKDLYGWTMDEIVAAIGKKNNCTFCGVFRRQALDRGAALIGADMIVTGHNADDVAETVIMNILRGDLARLTRCTNIVTEGEGTIPRCKPLMYAYEKEIVMYAHYKKLVYFSTECIYSPEAYRGITREYIKELERVRPSCLMDIIHSGESIKVNKNFKLPPRRTCTRCGFVASQEICKACVLLEGLNTGNPKLGVGKSNKAKRALGIKVLDGSENKSKREKPIDESKRKIRREKKKSSYYCTGGCSSRCRSDKSNSKEAEEEDDSFLLADSNIYEEENACGSTIDYSEFSNLNISADAEEQSTSEDKTSLGPEDGNPLVPEDSKSPVTKTEEDEEVVCKCSKTRAPPKPRHSQKEPKDEKPHSFKEATYNFELLFALMKMDTSSPECKIDFSFLDETWKTMQKRKKGSDSAHDSSIMDDVNEPKTASEKLKDLKIKDIIPPSKTKCWEDPKTWVVEDEDDPGSLYCKMVNKWLFTTFVRRYKDSDSEETEQSGKTTLDVQSPVTSGSARAPPTTSSPSTSKASTSGTSEGSQKNSEKISKAETSKMSSQELLESSNQKGTIESIEKKPEDLKAQLHSNPDENEQTSGEAVIVKATPKRVQPSLMLPEMMHKAKNNLDF